MASDDPSLRGTNQFDEHNKSLNASSVEVKVKPNKSLKKHKCQKCPLSFDSIKHLQRHDRTHTGGKTSVRSRSIFFDLTDLDRPRTKPLCGKSPKVSDLNVQKTLFSKK